MKNVAIFASGSGTNTENIINYFKDNKDIKISCILCNKKDAYVLTRAKNHNINFLYFNRDYFYNSAKILDFLSENKVDFIVLAGFLWLIPSYLINIYSNKIINIHPALLPKYGGKGMYGDAVHKAVYENSENETGITIHYVNEKYDEGDIIFQAKCKVDKNDTPETIANKVHQLEYKHFPTVIEKLVLSL
jgi:phosphoribosylglycinamide formyltransferase 1